MKSLTDKTTIPIGLAILAIGGGSAWLTRMASQASANSDDISQLQKKQENAERIIRRMDKKLDRVMVNLNIEPLRERDE